jgi:hypothetical protein
MRRPEAPLMSDMIEVTCSPGKILARSSSVRSRLPVTAPPPERREMNSTMSRSTVFGSIEPSCAIA